MNNKTSETELQSALHFAIGQICLSVERDLEKESSKSSCFVRMNTDAISTLTDITYQYATTYLANDLVAFSQHANRRTITVEDVKLAARKEPTKLLPSLQEFEAENLNTTTRSKTHDKQPHKKKKNKNRVQATKIQQKSLSTKKTAKVSNSIVEIGSDSSSNSSVMSSDCEAEFQFDEQPKKKESKRENIQTVKSDLSDTSVEGEQQFILNCSSSDDEDDSDDSDDSIHNFIADTDENELTDTS